MGRSGKRNSGGHNRRDRNQTERLPKAERTESGPKFTLKEYPYSLTPSSSTGSFEVAVSNVSVASRPSPPTPERMQVLPLALLLPDDILRRILHLAGLLSVVNATRVHRRWRRVAVEMLVNREYIHAASLFKHVPVAQLSYPVVLSTLRSVPELKRLSLAGWPTAVALQDIASSIMQHYASPHLREIDLSGLNFEHGDLHALSVHCPALTSIKLDSCNCVNDALVKRLVDTRRGANRDRGTMTRFAMLDVSGTAVTGSGIVYALQSKLVDNLVSMRSYKLSLLSAQNVSTAELNLSNSKNLSYASMSVGQGALQALNASHCKNLARISITRVPPRPGVPPVGPLALETLNLHGVQQLFDIAFDRVTPAAAAGPVVGAPGGAWGTGNAAPRHLPNLRHLVLMNARSLRPEFFRERLGLSDVRCPMPKLRTINLNGCLCLDRLVLVSYPHLRSVLAAGCTTLSHVQVRDTPELESLDVSGKRVPLTLVDMLVPRTTGVTGIRAQWTHVLTATTQQITYHQ